MSEVVPVPSAVSDAVVSVPKSRGRPKKVSKSETISPPEVEQMNPSSEKSAVEATRSNPVQDLVSIWITKGLNSSEKVSTSVPLSKVKEFLKANRECYERTLPIPDEPNRIHNRAYVDIDGEMTDIDETMFQEKVSAITDALQGDLTYQHSLMSACKYRCFNDKGESHNKLSFRILFTALHGDKKSISFFVKTKVYPILRDKLKDIIPVICLDAGAKIKGSGKGGKKTDYSNSLLLDMAVYNDGLRKMRMAYQSKPTEDRPNVILKGDLFDTLITYIPPTSVLLPQPLRLVPDPTPVSPSLPSHDENETTTEPSLGQFSAMAENNDPMVLPTEDFNTKKDLLMRVCNQLSQIRYDYYPYWWKLGAVFYNLRYTLEDFIEISKRSKHYKASSSPAWIKDKWSGYRKTNLTEGTLWFWLSEDDPTAYSELVLERTDFWNLIYNINNAEIGQFFYNMKSDSYAYHESLGWYSLQGNNIWKHYDKNPTMLKADIWNTLKSVAVRMAHILKAQAETDDEEQLKRIKERNKAIYKFLHSVGTSGFVDGVIQFLPSCYFDDDLPKLIDEQLNLFAFSDKVLDLNDFSVRDIDPKDYICINTGYPMPKESNPQIRKQLLNIIRSCFEEDSAIESSDTPSDLTRAVLQSISMCLSGLNKYERFYVWTGKGGNGKGMLSDMVKRALGDYYHIIPNSVITKPNEKKDATNPSVAKAKGKRFLQASEPEADDKLQVGCIKEFSGNDEICVRDLYKTTIKYKPQWVLFLQTNGIPKLNRPDGGIARRLRVVRFPYSFVQTPTAPHHKKVDIDLKDKIGKSAEWRDEFILLLIEFHKDMKMNGLVEPKEILEASQEYMEENNPVGTWLKANYDTGFNLNDKTFWLNTTDLRNEFESWFRGSQSSGGNRPQNNKMMVDTINASAFKTAMETLDMTLTIEKHDFTALRWFPESEEFEIVDETDIENIEIHYEKGEWKPKRCGAGRYWCGLKKKSVPMPDGYKKK